MGEGTDFRDKQYAFARHIRDPDKNPAPSGTEDRRMAVYRELFFNNLKNLLSQTFPVLKKLHDQDKWNGFIRQFMAQHEAHTPYFLEIPQEFLSFLENEYQLQDDDYPFLLELAHYEWVELALSVSEETIDVPGVGGDGDCRRSRNAWPSKTSPVSSNQAPSTTTSRKLESPRVWLR